MGGPGWSLLVACANTMGAVGRERWEGILPGSVAGRRAAMSPVHRRAGGSQITQTAVQDRMEISPEQGSRGQGEPSFLYAPPALAKLTRNR